jgi:hypothetical protein
MSKLTNIRAKVIPEPTDGTKTVFKKDGVEPIVIGDGDTSYVCGNCDHVLLSNVRKEELSDIVYVCFSCGSFNEIE